MPFAPTLPPELLLEIFSNYISKSPSRSFPAHLSRQTDLRAFSLVHRSWNPLAQDLLQQKGWISGSEKDTTKKKWEKRYFRSEVKCLTATNDPPSLRDHPDPSPFIEVASLRYFDRLRSTITEMSYFAHLPNLEALYLEAGVFEVEGTSLLLAHDLNMDLETVHLSNLMSTTSRTSLLWYQSTGDWVVQVAQGKRENIKIGKIVVYGHKEWLTKSWPELTEDLVEWREECMCQAFGEFDGK